MSNNVFSQHVVIPPPEQYPTDKVAIAYCHTGMVHEEFAYSLGLLCMCEGGLISALLRTSGPIIPMNRNEAVNKFLETPTLAETPWLWFVDTDMTFPPHTLRELITVAQKTEADIVCGAYATNNGTTIIAQNPGLQAFPLEHKDRAYDCDAGGTGCMLIRRSFLEKMRGRYWSERPWQFFQYQCLDKEDGSKLFVGEDFMFCLRARGIGAKIVAWGGLPLGHKKLRTITL